MACDVLDKTNQLTGNNEGERRYKISLCKVCFLARKDKQCDRQPSPLGLFTDRNDAFPYPKKSYPFLAEPSRIGHYEELKVK